MRRIVPASILLMTFWLPFSLGSDSPRVETRVEPKIEYLGEKNGPVETALKKAVVAILEKNADVRRAYLAMISTDGKRTWSVALCFASKKSDDRLVSEIGGVFKRMFGKDQFLDMMFLSTEAERDLRLVCAPFYVKNDA